MRPAADACQQLGTLDTLASGDSSIHRLDARAKLAVAALFVILVASYGRYQVSALLPYSLFPVTLAALAGLPPGFLLRRMLAALPLVLLMAALNPVLDRAPLFQAGPLSLSGGWLSLASILLRFALTVGTALVLVATTRFEDLCLAAERLGLPRVFTLQMAFLYRYAFVLDGETQRLLRARSLRAFGRKIPLSEFSSLAGGLLLRTWDRARRIHLAMLARGFTGQFHGRRPAAWGWPETLFTLGWVALFALMRLLHLPRLLGELATGGRG